MASLGELTATLRANTTDFTAKMDAATASSAKLATSLQDPVAQLRQLAIQSGRATGEMRAMLEAQQQSIIQGLRAKGLVIINGQLAYSATAAAEAEGKLAVATTKAAVAGTGFASNASRIERSLASLITRMAGIPEQAGSIGVALGRTFLGTIGALASVAAIGLVFAAISGLIEHFRKAAKEAEASAQRIDAAFKRITLKDQYDDVNKAADDLAKTQAKLAQMQANPLRSRTVLGASGQAETLTSGYSPAEIAAQQQAVIAATIRLQAAKRALEDAQGESRGYGKSAATASGSSAADAAAKRAERLAQLNELGISVGDGAILGASDKDFAGALEAFRRYQQNLQRDQIQSFNNRQDELARERAQEAADQQAALDEQQARIEAANRRIEQSVRAEGQQLAGALAGAFVEGNFATRLETALKRVFEDVIARLIQDKIFKKLEDALINALEGAQSSNKGGGGLLGAIASGVGAAVATIATGGGAGVAIAGGGAGALASQGMQGGTYLARSGGAPTLVVNATGSIPRALSPVEHARDAQWLALFAETARVAPSLGIRMGVT